MYEFIHITPRLFFDGIARRHRTVAEVCGNRHTRKHQQAIAELYSTMVDIARTPDQIDQYHQRMRDASEVASAIFRHAGGDFKKVEQVSRIIENIKADSAAQEDNARLIKADEFWSTQQGRSLTREQVMAWATRTYDAAESDRFWVRPRRFIAIARVPTDIGTAWMMTVFMDGKVVSSKQTPEPFEMMVYFDLWVEDLRHG